MSRQKIWKKDDYFQTYAGGRIDMDPAVVELPTEPIPLLANFNYTTSYGQVVDIRLEDGEITGKVLEDPDRALAISQLLELDCRLGGYYKGVYYTDEDKSQVATCRLSAVSFVLEQNMPGYPKEG